MIGENGPQNVADGHASGTGSGTNGPGRPNEAAAERGPEYRPPPTTRPRKVYSGMWGTAEMAVFGVSLAVLSFVAALYVLFVAPSTRELDENRAEARRLEGELLAARARYGDIASTETQVAKLVASVDEFESRYLPVPAFGRTALYQRLNGLISAYGLVNTSGPAYAPLDPVDAEQRNGTEEETGRAKYRSLFPGVYVTVTVEGPYHNLRRFIREIETGNDFVVISSVELAPSESTVGVRSTADGQQPGGTQTVDPVTGMPQQAVPAPAMPSGRTLGERVALRLEMAAYFRRQMQAQPQGKEQARPVQ